MTTERIEPPQGGQVARTSTPPADDHQRWHTLLRRRPSIVTLPAYTGVLVAFVLLVVYLCIAEPQFRTETNVMNILRTSSVPMVLAIGVTFTVLHGGIDLSVGSLLALVGVVMLGLLHTIPEPLAIVGAIAFGGLLGGAINGSLIGFLRLSPLVTTLGTLAIFRGLAYVITDGDTQYIDQYTLVQDIGDGSIWGFPIPAIVMLVFLVIAAFVLRSTYFGRDVYAIGGNEEAARLCGIPVARVTMFLYVISGFAAGLAAVMQAGRLSSVAPGVGGGIELYVAAAVLLGGTSLSGGSGSVFGTFIAVLFLGTIENGLTITGVAAFWQQVVTGTILIVAVLFDRVRQQLIVRRRAREVVASV